MPRTSWPRGCATRTTCCVVIAVSASCVGVVDAQEPVRIPRVPLSDPGPTCHPDPACAGENEPMDSFAVSTGGVGGRTGEYAVTAFRLVRKELGVGFCRPILFLFFAYGVSKSDFCKGAGHVSYQARSSAGGRIGRGRGIDVALRKRLGSRV